MTSVFVKSVVLYICTQVGKYYARSLTLTGESLWAKQWLHAFDLPYSLQVALCSVARPRCPAGCSCPEDPCAPGAQPVPAGCACCGVCARQRGESCSKRAPCDGHRGLHCDRRSHVCVGACVDLNLSLLTHWLHSGV